MQKRVLMSVVIFMTMMLSAANAAQLPYGTHVTVRLGRGLSSASARAGQGFDATVAKDVVVDGKRVVKAGAPARGKVLRAKSSGRLHAPGILAIRLTSVDGMPVTTTSRSVRGKSHTKSNATKIGGGAGAGALIGGLAGGGKGALIGAAAGGAAGTGVAAYSGKQEAVMPAESVWTFSVTSGKAVSASRR